MKKLLLSLALLLVLSACSPLDDRADKDTVFRLVENDRAVILECIESGDYGALEWKLSIREINVYDDHVDFYCGGAGFGSQTAYRGFFYSESGDMYAVWCAPPRNGDLTAEGNGWRWTETDGDNTVYIEEICENFYYYDASF